MLEFLNQGLEAFVGGLEEMFQINIGPELRAMLMTSHVQALIAALSLWEKETFEDILPTIPLPCLLCVGEDEEAYPGSKKASEIIPSATFISVPGGHLAGIQVDLLLPHVRKFLAEVSRA